MQKKTCAFGANFDLENHMGFCRNKRITQYPFFEVLHLLAKKYKNNKYGKKMDPGENLAKTRNSSAEKKINRNN